MGNEALKIIKLQLLADDVIFRSLDGQSKICNWLYNHLLEKAHFLRQRFIESQDKESAKIVYTERGLRNQLPLLKKEKPFLKSVHSSPLKNSIFLPTGSYSSVPAKHHHYAWCSEDTILQLNNFGLWDIFYVNPKDDPRNK